MTKAYYNALGQPVGEPLVGWTARPLPPRTPMEGDYCRMEPLSAEHAESLFAASQDDPNGKYWTYLPYGPFDNIKDFQKWMQGACQKNDPLFYAIIDKKDQKTAGMASYMRIDPAYGVIEVGYIYYSPRLQRTPAATEAMYLMMRRAFDELGYRRYEWKCNAHNAPSRQAADRLGFRFEGIFRQAVIHKERNRDTAWYSIIDKEWPVLKAAFECWLRPENFDKAGRQREHLSLLTAAALSDMVA